MGKLLRDGKGNPLRPTKVDVGQLRSYKCKSCGCMFFESALELKVLPFIVSPSGKNEVISIQHMVCKQCGRPAIEKDIFETTPKEEKDG